MVDKNSPEIIPDYFYRMISNYTMPENPIKAMANNPAVRIAIAGPCIPLGIFTSSSCSRIPANMVRA